MYRSYLLAIFAFFFYTTLYDCILFYGPIVPEINYSILFYSNQKLMENAQIEQFEITPVDTASTRWERWSSDVITL